MEINRIFSSFISYEQTHFDFNLLENEALKLVSQSHNGDNTYQHRLVDNVHFNPVLSYIENKMNEVYYSIGFDNETRLRRTQSWINTNYNYDISLPHDHPLSVLSAVLYIKADDTSSGTTFLRPTPDLKQKTYVLVGDKSVPLNVVPTEFVAQTCTVSAQTGKLVIFPSYLMHFVVPPLTKNDKSRITLAVDSTQVFQ